MKELTCPNCGNAVSPAPDGQNGSMHHYLCLRCGWQHFEMGEAPSMRARTLSDLISVDVDQSLEPGTFYFVRFKVVKRGGVEILDVAQIVNVEEL